jgi:hypothetical protein
MKKTWMKKVPFFYFSAQLNSLKHTQKDARFHYYEWHRLRIIIHLQGSEVNIGEYWYILYMYPDKHEVINIHQYSLSLGRMIVLV